MDTEKTEVNFFIIYYTKLLLQSNPNIAPHSLHVHERL
jgi:hypothetical protein